MVIGCDLAEDLRDAIVEYQVSTRQEQVLDSPLTRRKVLAADSGL
jgi:hypothetical protein